MDAGGTPDGSRGLTLVKLRLGPLPPPPLHGGSGPLNAQGACAVPPVSRRKPLALGRWLDRFPESADRSPPFRPRVSILRNCHPAETGGSDTGP